MIAYLAGVVVGYRVLRFTNADVMENVEGVVLMIRATVQSARLQAHP